MKIILLGLSLVLLQQQSFAQTNVGIGTASPDNSAALDIKNTQKGLLIPRVYLTSIADKTTIPNPATSLMLYNTSPYLPGGTGYYYNKGTTVSPNWVDMSDFDLPVYKAATNAASTFQIDNYSQSANSSAIKGYSAAGIGVYAVSSTGYALITDGKVRIAGSDQSPAQGKVLTSDASGNVSWEGAIAFNATGVVGGNSNVAPNVDTKVAFNSERYDLGNNYNNAAATPYSTFIAPVHGIYHFEAQVSFFALAEDPTIYMMQKKNGIVTSIADMGYGTFLDNPLQALALQLQKDVELVPGDEIYIVVKHTSSDNRSLRANDSAAWFSGRLVIKLQ